MAQAKSGDTVQVHYIGTLDDGTIFDTTMGHVPLQFTIGNGEILVGFEQAVIGMSPGEWKTARILSEQGLELQQERKVQVIDRNQFPVYLNPKVGQQYRVLSNQEQPVVVTVTHVSNSSVVLDHNHPLASRHLTFDIQLIDIVIPISREST